MRELRDELCLEDCPKITDAGLENLGDLPKLQTLNVAQTQVSGAGLKHQTGLRALLLNNAKVTDEGLGGLERLANLESLNLSGQESRTTV